jgi:hypothetical protein
MRKTPTHIILLIIDHLLPSIRVGKIRTNNLSLQSK